MTTQLKERIITLNVGNPRQFAFVYTIEVGDGLGRGVESILHDKLGYNIPGRQKKGKGEWFLIDELWLDTVMFELRTRDLAMLEIDADITHH